MIFKKTFLIMAASLAMSNFLLAQDKLTDFKPTGNLWGLVFGDFYYQTHRDSLGRGGGNVQYRGNFVITNSAANGNNSQIDAFQIRRAYLGYDFNMNNRVSVNTILAHEEGPNDVSSPGTKGLDAGGNNTLYLKYLYLKVSDIFKGSDLLIGQMRTPSFATDYSTQPLSGYRSIERSVMDMHAVDASVDMGAALEGHLWTRRNVSDSLGSAFIGYNVMIGNNSSSAMATPNDRFKRYRGTLFVNTLQQKLTVGVYADQYTVSLLRDHHQLNITLKGYVHYGTDWFRIGAEVFNQTNQNQDIYTTSKTAKADTSNGIQFGWSVFGSSRIIKGKLNVFARMDQYNPDIKFNKNYLVEGGKYTASQTGGNFSTTTFYTQTFYSFGFDYTPFPRVHFMPNVWLNQYNSMLANQSGNTKFDYDLVYRLTFYVIFNSAKSVRDNGLDN